ncbi:MAG: hypothetical protein HOE90_02095 [Bacteriovoracaceae bacterium]|jgi:hypothetical protein|nr:hypothetical protein [Bacteriovoracaceae bacterium]
MATKIAVLSFLILVVLSGCTHYDVYSIRDDARRKYYVFTCHHYDYCNKGCYAYCGNGYSLPTNKFAKDHLAQNPPPKNHDRIVVKCDDEL